jgi:O-antigen/teichoic acid export membrane protein
VPGRADIHVLGRGVAWNWVGFLVVGGVSFAITPFMIRHLGELYYGIWMLGHSVLSYYTLCDLGLSPSVQRFVALSRSTGDPRIASEAVSAGVAMMTVMGILVAAGTVIIAILLPRFGMVSASTIPVFRTVLLILGGSVAISFPARPLSAYLGGVHRFDLANGISTGATLLRAGCVCVLLNRGHGVIAVSLVSLLSAVIALAAYIAAIRSLDSDVLRFAQGFHWGKVRKLGQFSFYVFLADIGEYLRLYLDSVVVAKWVGVVFVTYYSVAGSLISFQNNMMAGVAGPLMTELVGRDGEQADEGRNFFLRSTKLTTLLATLGAVLLVTNGKLLLQVWLGPKFLWVYTTLVVLTVAHWIDRAQSPSMHLLYSRGRHKAMAYWTILEGVANLALSIYLAKRIGIVGVALGTAIPLIIVKLFVQPLYTLNVAKTSVTEYISKAMGRPILVGAIVLFAGCASSSQQGSIVALVLRVMWETALFAVVAWALVLTRAERSIFLDRIALPIFRFIAQYSI